jgi:hypothetical protein
MRRFKLKDKDYEEIANNFGKYVIELESNAHKIYEDEYGRPVSQWRLSLYLNGELLYESGRPGEPYIQYFQSADFIVIGDDYMLREDMPPEENHLGPTTGDSFGIVYVDAARAYQQP